MVVSPLQHAHQFQPTRCYKSRRRTCSAQEYYRPTGYDGSVLDREPAERGLRHLVSKRDVQALIDIIPDWHPYFQGLERIVLATPSDSCYGVHEFYHREETGAIFLYASHEGEVASG